MEHAELAARLVEAGGGGGRELLLSNAALADAKLAYLLKDACIEGWSSQPARAVNAASALKSLAEINDDPEIAALSSWGAAMAALVEGRMETALSLLDDSRSRFLALGKEHPAAATQIIKLFALAMLGRYEEAVECGLRARDVMLAHGDTLSVGKLEHNIGNIYFRRALYSEAEQYQSAARERFLALGDQAQLAKIDNSLALTHSQQHKVRSAELLYEQSLRRAEAVGLPATQAEVLSSIGNLALFQGRYDRALDFLERSRRKYVELGSPHQSALTEQEIADAYLELNLAPEAAASYERLTRAFANLGMRAEEARALAYHGRSQMLLGNFEKAYELLGRAREVYAAEGNALGEATVTLNEAQLFYQESKFEEAQAAALSAEVPLAASGAKLWELQARWLRGESARALGHLEEARSILSDTLHEAESQSQPQVAERCHISLGLLSEMAGDRVSAEASFKSAVALIETLRAPLPAEEFRTAFFSNKLTPYEGLVRLCLADADESRVAEALDYTERARSRSLADAMGGGLQLSHQPRDRFEADLLRRYERLREELNYFYNQLHRPAPSGVPRDPEETATLQSALSERESEALEIMRQLQHRGAATFTPSEGLDVARLRRDLGQESALVEYASIGGELLAFVVTDAAIEVVRDLCVEEEAREALGHFRFQIDTLRYGAGQVRRHLGHLSERARHHLRNLYRLLVRPLEPLLGDRRLVVVPYRELHYVPFHALHDGTGYVVERREVCYAPSAAVLRYCLNKPRRAARSALLLGVADEQTPRVRDEIKTLAPLFPDSVALLDEEATLAALREHAPGADVLHLACHGQFRPDNPLFSALRLGDGWLTVRDAYGLNLSCEVVTLSACETGVSGVAPGEELIGLSRGFFSAGAPSLVMSLWTVDDEATAELMNYFYTSLLSGASPCAALRAAQLRLIEDEPHPFFWSPFVLFGRW